MLKWIKLEILLYGMVTILRKHFIASNLKKFTVEIVIIIKYILNFIRPISHEYLTEDYLRIAWPKL